MFKKKTHINISERLVLLRLFDILSSITALGLLFYYFDFDYFKNFEKNLISWTITLSIYLLFFGQIFEMYRLKVASDGFLVIRSVFLTALVTTIFFVFTPYVAPVLPVKRIQILYLFSGIFIPVVIWRFAYILFIFSPKFFKDILILGDSKSVAKVIDLIQDKAPENHIVGYFTNKKLERFDNIPFFDNKTENLKHVVICNNVTEVIVTDGLNFEKFDRINKWLIELFEDGIAIKNIENYYQEITLCMPRRYLTEDFYKNIAFSKTLENRIYLSIIRLVDIVFSIIGLIFMILMIPLVFIGNLISNRGPLFYSQERVGLKGRPIKINKFRTMIKNAETKHAVWAEKKDPRVTPFGKILRKTRIDETPQFYNILKGEMALIGPRPERPEFVDQLSQKILLYETRHVIKPGLTGWAQVMYPYAATVEEHHKKLRFDLYYIKYRSFFLDFKIMIKTISAVLFLRGN